MSSMEIDADDLSVEYLEGNMVASDSMMPRKRAFVRRTAVESTTESGECAVCNNLSPADQTLCTGCLQHPSKTYVDMIIQKHTLDPEQVYAFKQVVAGDNVIISGSAGTGKSKLVRAIAEYLKGLGLVVDTVAPTSLPATSIGGRVLKSALHSYVGWAHDVDAIPLHELLTRARGGSGKARPLTDVLVMDEISMLDSFMLTRLSLVLSAVAWDSDRSRALQPFGGAQLVFSADFHQLPPIQPLAHCLCGLPTIMDEQSMQAICSVHGQFDRDKNHAFNSPIWDKCVFQPCNLSGKHRQKDPELLRILETLRCDGRIPDEHFNYLYQRASTRDTADISEATTLYAKGVEAKQHNHDAIKLLPSTATRLKAFDTFLWQSDRHSGLAEYEKREKGDLRALRQHHFESKLDLKQNMLVLLVTDLDESAGLVSGTLGRVIYCAPFPDDSDEALPRAESAAASGEVRGPGQVLRGPHRNYQENQIKQFFKLNPRLVPVVKFSNGGMIPVFPTCSVQELGNDKPPSLLSRTQIPLAPGYAMSVHRSQGLTLDRVAVLIHDCTKENLAYVALSRVRSLDRMILRSLPTTVRTSDEVRKFNATNFGNAAEDSDEEEESVNRPGVIGSAGQGGVAAVAGGVGGGGAGSAQGGAGQVWGYRTSLAIRSISEA